MTQTIHITSSAELYENEFGELAIRFANNQVYEGVGTQPGKSFATEARDLLEHGRQPPEWRPVPHGKLQHDGHGWHLVGSLGYIDDDTSKPAVGLDVKPEQLGDLARRYLRPDLPEKLQEKLRK